MKTAIIISGEPRTFRDCFPSLKSNILSQNECDIFLQLYDGSDVEEVLETYKPIRYVIENKSSVFVDVSPICNQNKPPEVNPHGVFFQWRNIKKSFELIGDGYECVLRTRYDVKYTNPLNISIFDLGCLNIPIGGDWRGGLFDMMAFGSPSVMSHYCSLYDDINNHAKNGIPCHSEIMNSFHNRNQKINRFEYTVLLRRQFDKPYVEDRVFTLR